MRRTQQDRSAGTKAALVAAARELFAVRGYQAVPADEITRAAGVTRGALYHHYGDKQGLFRAVVEELERELTEEVEAAFGAAADPLTGMLRGLGVFLDACLREEVRRISLTDAPAVLGWEVWREIEAEYGLGLLVTVLEQARADGLIVDQPVRALAQLVLSAVMEAARMIAAADDPERTRAEVQQVLGGWLGSLLRS
ncbi:TetR/AcrR family transcriptional regulator [Amycolatopsis sp. SID8362]|uniref:TetR/AcrR family transcriptional regulator n=1 Tax=Amycolatopsis sp. SID8362 TaxID=2690346 RepID=UPI001371DBEC|nr:TetR/AcrR family transcriptional regulator [Amycolatopsis sp. SID8362]NBH02971.1 TetR family transcriptional regulator [Amycolatopsis sp. SID8362]NED39672.1 TetR/AcrR family transcriptional regulator [Amycolatopsis sp. SID8362]